MPFVKFLSEDAGQPDIVRALAHRLRGLPKQSQRILREPSELTPAQREFIGSYVSGLNDCPHWHHGHAAVAAAHGADDSLIDQALANLDAAPIEENFKALLRYVEKLTYTPSAMTQEDADAVFAAGWSEQALADAICVCAHFNMVNRLVEGLGAGRHHTRDPMRKAAALVAEKGYPTLVFGDW